MFVSDLSLDDFRSYRRLVLSLEAGPTAFIGANGQGKTNLVEAIAYLATLSSHRVGADTALVRRARPGEPQPAGAVVRAKTIHGQRPTVVEIEIIAGRANRARLNRGSCRPRDLVGVLRTVVFAPEDLALVREEPGLRRRFLDDLAVMMRPGLAAVRAEHDKILAQRASLLKSARASRSSGAARSSMLSTLEVWDAQLAAAASRLIAARIEVLSRLRPWVEAAYEEVSQVSGHASGAQLAYRSSLLIHDGAPEPDPRDEQAWCQGEAGLADAAATAARLEAAMSALHTREIERGANLVGAHRDDLALFLGGLPARGFASHGEQWSLALALRLASYNMLRHDLEAYGGDGEPVLILDDVFASLDQRRRRALATMVSGAQQVLLTAAVDQDVPEELSGARFRVEGGEVTRG
ncbi:DNA replication/repair protein RecF [Actinomyces capricornis]|uniref:DNA replication and repair protein RecF n=1 Tax=Actinomyces capricornis TaxID=2755559 RepID=A0ABN6K3U6_9ACTO|nr:DNA replication/repair protein RecF [Actinomyces capricornis]BDA64292.1 DNA replication and repair protein RecF [Actinomyces capricornis]